MVTTGARQGRLLVVLLLVAVTLSFGIGVVPAGAVGADRGGNSSEAGESASACSPEEAQSATISYAQIKATDPTVTTDQPASVSGQVTAPQSNRCVVVVQVIMTVPSGMYVSGTNNVNSGGQGQLTSSFEVYPGESVTMSANLFATDTGSELVIVDFRYYPKGHSEESHSLNGFSLQINVAEPNSHTTTATPQQSDELPPLLYVTGGLLSGAFLVLFIRK